MVSEQLLNVLKLCLLALLYLFFLRVLRAVWVEVKGPALAVTAASAATSVKEHKHGRRHVPTQLKVIAPPEMVGLRFDLAEELTVGRAAGCQITLDDTFASQVHARVFRRDGQLYVEDLGSTNGTWLNREKVTGPLEMERGDHLQVGNTVLELA